MKQGLRTLVKYNAELRTLWQEINFYEDFQADCGLEAKKYQSKVEN